MIGRTHCTLLLLTDILLDDAILFESRFNILLLFRSSMNPSIDDFSQLEALELVKLGSRQVATIDEKAHELLVIDNSEVVRLEHLTLERLLNLLITQVGSPCRLRHYDGTQQLAVLNHGSLLDILVIMFDLELYLIRLYVLAIWQDNKLLAAACNIESAMIVERTEITCAQPAI